MIPLALQNSNTGLVCMRCSNEIFPPSSPSCSSEETSSFPSPLINIFFTSSVAFRNYIGSNRYCILNLGGMSYSSVEKQIYELIIAN